MEHIDRMLAIGIMLHAFGMFDQLGVLVDRKNAKLVHAAGKRADAYSGGRMHAPPRAVDDGIGIRALVGKFENVDRFSHGDEAL